jgi:O-antigen ligase
MATFLLGVYIALIFIRPMDWWEPVLGFQLVTVAAILTLLTSMDRFLKQHQVLWRSVPEIRLAVWTLAGITASWAVYPFWLSGMWSSFQEMGKIIVLFVLIVLLARKPSQWTLLMWMIMLCVAWMAVHGILQIRRGYGFGGLEPRWRPDSGVFQTIAFGIFEDPNDLCAAYVFVVPLLIAEIRATNNVLVRGLALAIIPLMVYAAWLTNSRGGVVGLFGMFMAFAIGRQKKKFRRWILAILGIVLISVVAPSRFGKGLTGGGRLVLWGDGIAAWKTHPIFGVGWGDFGSYSDETKAAHNTYIHMLTETGLVGYIPFVMWIYFTTLHLRRAINLRDLIAKRWQYRLVGLYASVVCYLTTIYFISRQDTHVLYIILGMSTAIVLVACEDPKVYQAVIGPWRDDLKKAFRFAILSVPFLYLSIRLGYALGVG